MFQFAYSYFYVSPSLYMAVYFNLPISKIIHTYTGCPKKSGTQI